MPYHALQTSLRCLTAGLALSLASPQVSAQESRAEITLASAPLILRDGRRAAANVLHIAFAPNTASLSPATRASMERLLHPVEASCVLSAQIVGVASELETAPRVVVDAQVLARDRADGIAQIVLDRGVPGEAVASVWTVESDARLPWTTVWLFLDDDTPGCGEQMQQTAIADGFSAMATPIPVIADAATDEPVLRLPIARRPSLTPAQAAVATRVAPEVTSDMPVAEPFSLSFPDNSSYLNAGEMARLRTFTGTLDRECKLVLTATVAGGGADTRYAAWLAQRRLDRVAGMLRNLVSEDLQIEYLLEPNDSRRQVSLLVPTDAACSATRPVFLANQS